MQEGLPTICGRVYSLILLTGGGGGGGTWSPIGTSCLGGDVEILGGGEVRITGGALSVT